MHAVTSKSKFIKSFPVLEAERGLKVLIKSWTRPHGPGVVGWRPIILLEFSGYRQKPSSSPTPLSALFPVPASSSSTPAAHAVYCRLHPASRDLASERRPIRETPMSALIGTLLAAFVWFAAYLVAAISAAF
jgi:hypothetical protein